MNFDLKDLPAKITPILQGAQKYSTVLIIVLFVSMYGFLLLRINSLSTSTPSEDEVTERLKTVQRPRIDEEAARKIEQLEDQNIQVQTLFNNARQNPFTE